MFIEWSTAGGTPGTFALRGTIPYLQNGNILAAHTFITHFTAAVPKLHSSLQSAPISVGPTSEVTLTTDSLLNFCQIAVVTCQRAQGDQNKVMREAWVRLCGTYQSRGGVLATPEVRTVSVRSMCLRTIILIVNRQALNELATLYFAIPAPRNQAANPLGDMLSSLFGGPGQGAPTRRVLSPAAPGLD